MNRPADAGAEEPRHGVLSAGHDVEHIYPLWTLDDATVTRLVDAGGIVVPTGGPGWC